MSVLIGRLGVVYRPLRQGVMNNQEVGRDMGASKMRSDCAQLAKESYKCLETHGQEDRDACSSHFEAYKDCRKREHTRIVEERRKKFS